MLASSRLARFAVLAAAALVFSAAGSQAASAAGDPAKQIRAWIADATSTKPVVKGHKSKLRIPKKLRRALPALTKTAAALARRAAAVDPKSIRPKSIRPRRAARAAAASDVVAVMDLPSVTKVVNGVELSAVAHVTKYEDGTVDSQYEISAKSGEYTVRMKPVVDMNEKGIPEVGCPTADGKLSLTYTSTSGGTLLVLKGRTVLGARTVRAKTTTTAQGQVGRDARLASVNAQLSGRSELYERGLQVVTTFSRDYSMRREGTPAGGRAKADVRIKAAQASRAQESEAERAIERQFETGDGADLASVADLPRWRMLQDEYKWYQLPNYCASAHFDPEPIAKLQKGQTKQVSGVVTAQGGAESPGTFSVTEAGRGAFAAVKADSDPGSPALFSATAAEPDGAGTTVAASVVATSMGGRAQATWEAEGDKVKVPDSFGGWIMSKTEGNGLKYEFKAYVDFNRTYVNTGPNGFATAYYEIEPDIDVELSSNEIGSGCRWVAKGVGEVVNSGDVELRRDGYGAGWKYAIQIDFSIPDQTFKSTDCPPGAELPEFTGVVVNYLYTRTVDGPFRPIWAGSTEDDMRLIEMDDVSDVTGPGQLPTSAHWGLIGSFD